MDSHGDENGVGYQGWRVAAASGFGAFCTSLFVFSFAVLLRPLAQEFSWSREAVASAFGCMTLAVSFAAPLTGHVVDRFGPRRVVAPCLGAAAAGFGSLSLLTPHLWHLYAVYIVIGLASSGTSPVVYSRVISTWFDRRRGIALASVIASIGAGAVVHPPIVQMLIRAASWRTACVVMSGLILIVGVPVVARVVREQAMLASAPGARGVDATFGDAIRSRIFWTLIIVVFGSTIAMNGVVVHLSALLVDRGISASRAVLAMSSMGAASLTGRLLTGWLLDRWNATRVSFALLTLAATGTLFLSGAHTLPTGIVAAALIGFGTGGEVDVTPYLLSRYFGLRSLATLYGFTWLAFGLAGVIGPVLMGRAYDSTGSYDRVLIGFTAATFTVAALMLTLPAYKSERVDASAASA
jgi:MFS family permease